MFSVIKLKLNKRVFFDNIITILLFFMMNLLQKLMLAVFMRGWGCLLKTGLILKKVFMRGLGLLAENRVNTKKGFLRKNIVSVSFFQDCAIHPYT